MEPLLLRTDDSNTVKLSILFPWAIKRETNKVIFA